MQLIYLLLSAVLPIFAIMTLGYLAEKFHYIGNNASININGFVYYFAFPALLFGSIAKEPFSQILQGGFIVAICIGLLSVFVIRAVISRCMHKNAWATVGLESFAASFPNTGYMGIPILLVLFGEKGVLPGAMATILTMLLVGSCVFFVEVEVNSSLPVTQRLKKILINFCKNPLLSSSIIGICYAATPFPLPKIVDNFCHILGMAAAPAALFSIGASLYGKPMLMNKCELALVCGLKLIVQPVITLFLLLWLVKSPLWVASGLILTALPTGAVIYLIASQYGIYIQKSSMVILVSTILSLFTLTGCLWFIANRWPQLIH